MLILFISILAILIIINLSVFQTLDLEQSFNFISNFNINNSSF